MVVVVIATGCGRPAEPLLNGPPNSRSGALQGADYLCGVFARILANKYGIDDFYQRYFADGAVKLGNGLWKYADQQAIDGAMLRGIVVDSDL